MKVISTEKNLIKMWLDDIEESALQEVKNLANLPFIHKHIAIMPDCHASNHGMPIGGVMATKGVIIPNAVGVDIGCGMCAVKTSLTEIDTETLKKIMGEIRKVVPVGFNKHKENQDEWLMPKRGLQELFDNNTPIITNEYQNALKSLGTLGGGNHFIEIQKGSDGYVWIMLHSGSRNLGKQVADYYNKIAIDLNKKWHSSVPEEYKLAFLPIDSKEGKAYLREMKYCVEYAYANRKLMMERIRDIFINNTNCIFPEQLINIAHNYAQMENHFGTNVMVHRKGTTSAKEGEIGIIPGSQGTSSYIVQGLGNKNSFESCSHGAGRAMSRKRAIEKLDLETEISILNKTGIIHDLDCREKLDEASSAYKSIYEFMQNQEDLVEILVKLETLAVIKG